ncbi:MAG TPA: efflux RND transporter periplasmic adaptor subunit [Steroidobacteraceae bacterium]|nr:efflux RND transporter periplasmic adaptor subunit [Steroidobacteraceae bacterium]
MSDTNEAAHPLPAGNATPMPLAPGKLRRIGIIAAVVAVAIAVTGIVIREVKAHEVAKWTYAQAIPTVAIVMPQAEAHGTQLVLPGNIAAWYEAPIYARVSGYVKRWNFDYGAHVKKGQVLAVIDTPDLDAQFAAANATLNAARARVNVFKADMQFAQSTYARWRDSPQGVVSEQERESKKAAYASAVAQYDAAIADVKSDEGAVDRLRALEQFKDITAPFDGVVTARNTDIGDLITAGSASSAPQLFRMADVHKMRVFVQVPQAMSGSIQPGMTADLDLPQYPDRTFEAVVATTAQAINPAARTLLVELHAANPGGVLQPGTYAEVHFNLPPNTHVLTIPTTALVFRESDLQVAVVGPGRRVELKQITLGRNLGNDVRVLGGLSPSDRVINNPPDSLVNGEVVTMAKP